MESGQQHLTVDLQSRLERAFQYALFAGIVISKNSAYKKLVVQSCFKFFGEVKRVHDIRWANDGVLAVLVLCNAFIDFDEILAATSVYMCSSNHRLTVTTFYPPR